jgi:hypothetical protein
MVRGTSEPYGDGGLIRRTQGGTLIVRRLGLSFAIMATLLAAPATWAASGACSGPAHDPLLSGGGAAPAAGTTATTFTFSVTYADTKGCAPLWVRVTVSGVGTFPMSGSGTSYDTGVAFIGGMLLPAGTHTYSFAASSGIGAGEKTTTLTSVTPSSVSVSPPPPPPTPNPTPIPIPIPTPVPTPVPTAVPTSQPSPTPLASASETSSPAPSAGTGASQDPNASAGGAAASQGQGQVPSASGNPAGGSGGFNKTEELGSFSVLLAGWATTTLGGIALFLYMAPRRRMPDQRAVAESSMAARLAAGLPLPPGLPLVPPARPERVASDEANIPRWLRPSVQAARQDQRGSRSRGRRFDGS